MSQDKRGAPEQPGRVGLRRALGALRQRNYRLYFISGLAMTAAEGVLLFALPWLVLELTDSVGQVGISIFLRGIPSVLVALLGGVLADRYDRRKILIYSQFVTMVNMFALAGLIVGGSVEVWHVYIVSTILGITQSLMMPARQALIRGLVKQEDLMNAVSLNAFQQMSARVIWPATAGLIIQFAGVDGAVIACGLFYSVGIVFIWSVQAKREEIASSTASAIGQIDEGFRYIAATPLVGTVAIMMIAISVFGLAYMQLGPTYAREVFGLEAGEAGAFMMASGIGAMIGSLALVSFEVSNRTGMFVAFSALFAASLLGIALAPWRALAFLMMGIFGVSSAALVILGQTIFQAIVPDRFLGRVMSLWTVTGGISAMSGLPLGVGADYIGLRAVLAFDAIMLLAMAILVAVVRRPWHGPGREADEAKVASA